MGQEWRADRWERWQYLTGKMRLQIYTPDLRLMLINYFQSINHG
jgi:hypothetical protein